jgi:putative aldouronate transport system permease protein
MLFTSPGFSEALINTIKISFCKIVFGFPAPIILALLLNEVKNLRFKKMTQTLIYLPHFISWVVVGGIVYTMFSPSGGLVNELLGMFGIEPIYFLGDNKYFVSSLVLSDIWKETGWGTIVYLATLSQIDQSQYEACAVDGANRLQRIIYITLPALKEVIVVLLIMRLGKVLTVGFEQIMILGNPLVIPGRHVLETYTYNMGLLNLNYSLATAAGIFLSIVAAIMVYGSDRISKRLGGKGLV